jgi:hypothetical protein
VATDLYVLHYRIFQNKFVRYHDSLESARRDACAYILKYGIAELDLENDDSHHDLVEAVLNLVEEGDYDQAYRLYRAKIDEEEWDEHIEIEAVTFSNSADIPLLKVAAEQRERLLNAETKDADDDEDDEDSEEDEEDDDEDE